MAQAANGGTGSARSRAILITGCSSGIGRATAERLARRGATVYATARRPETLADLEAAGCRILALDVTNEASMAGAVSAVETAEGAVGVLVNNAGYGLEGPIEEVPLDAVRAQFETNVFGLTRMCQLVLPGMRRQRWGRIVNVSSMGGEFTLPGGGFYHATKHAVEAISDALRFEVAPFGVDVAVIQPGAIRTEFEARAQEAIESVDRPDSPYAPLNRVVQAVLHEAYQGRTARLASAGPESVARVIERAIDARRPRPRYRVTAAARMAIAARRLLPDRAWDAMLRRQYPVPPA